MFALDLEMKVKFIWDTGMQCRFSVIQKYVNPFGSKDKQRGFNMISEVHVYH